MWTRWPSARPTPRHGSWSCRSARPPSARGDRSGPCTRSRPPRSRRCSSRRSASPTRPSRSCAPSGGGGAPGDERLRFKDFEFQRLASGRCRAKVVLASSDGREFSGESEGIISQAGELRCGAAATVRALERVVQPKLGFELLGVKAVRAFDATVVIVSLSARQEARASRLVGAYLTETDAPRGAALAVLNATNRILGNFFATR